MYNDSGSNNVSSRLGFMTKRQMSPLRSGAGHTDSLTTSPRLKQIRLSSGTESQTTKWMQQERSNT